MMNRMKIKWRELYIGSLNKNKTKKFIIKKDFKNSCFYFIFFLFIYFLLYIFWYYGVVIYNRGIIKCLVDRKKHGPRCVIRGPLKPNTISGANPPFGISPFFFWVDEQFFLIDTIHYRSNVCRLCAYSRGWSRCEGLLVEATACMLLN